MTKKLEIYPKEKEVEEPAELERVVEFELKKEAGKEDIWIDKLVREIDTLMTKRKEKEMPEKNYQDEREVLKDKYKTDFPQDFEKIEVLFSIEDAIALSKEFTFRKEQGRTLNKEDCLKLTNAQAQFMKLIVSHRRSEKWLEKFWLTFHNAGVVLDAQDIAKGWKKGLLGQVALYYLLKEVGFRPILATPKEDAFEKTDMWCELPSKEAIMAVQVKSTDIREPLVVATDEITYPALIAKTEKATAYFAAHYIKEMLHFRRKYRRHPKKGYKEVRGLFVVLPSGQDIDQITGRPSRQLIESFRKSLEESNLVWG